MQVEVSIMGDPLKAIFDPQYRVELDNLRKVYENAPEVVEILVKLVIAHNGKNFAAVNEMLSTAAIFLHSKQII